MHDTADSSASTEHFSKATANTLLLKLSVLHFVIDGMAGFILPLLPLMAQKLHFDLVAAGLLSTVSSVSSSLLQPLWGAISERYPKRNYLLIGGLCAVLGISLMTHMPSYLSLMLAILIGYFGVGLIHPRALFYAHLASLREENFLMTLFITAGTAGFASGPFLVSTLVSQGGLTASHWALLLLIPVFWATWHIDKSYVKALAETRREKQSTSEAQTFWQSFQEAWCPSLSPTELRDLIYLSGAAILRATIMVALGTFIPFLWHDAGYPVTLTGSMMGISAIIGTILSIWMGKLSDKHGEKPIILWSFIPCILLLPFMGWIPAHYTPWLFLAIYSLIQISITANLVLAYKKINGHKSFISGIMAGFSFGTAGLFMPLFGQIATYIGIPKMLACLTILPVIAFILIWQVDTSTMQPETSSENSKPCC